MPSRSEYILLIVSRLGPPSVYDYWLSGYSLIISQKSITTSERMPEKINDLAAAETRNEVGSSRDATRRHCSILLRQSQSMTKKKLECYALPLAMYFLLEGMVEEEGDESSKNFQRKRYLYICICVFPCQTPGNIIFEIFVQ